MAAEKQVKKTAGKIPLRPALGSIRVPRFIMAISGYFKGAWFELRQVRWPDRKAAWGLTTAVILFSLFFAAIILGLDTLFQYIFKEIIL